jgi:hypothetical protein
MIDELTFKKLGYLSAAQSLAIDTMALNRDGEPDFDGLI